MHIYFCTGTFVLRVKAKDPDSDSIIEYSFVEPIRALDKTGVAVKSTAYNFRSAFRINSTTGEIFVNNALDYQTASVIILTVEAKDVNAVIDKEKQIAQTEVTIYVQAFSDDNPIFTNSGWSPNNPTIRISVNEELPIGTTLLKLSAKEPVTNYAIQRFELVHDNNEEEYVNIEAASGNVILSKRLDYEVLKNKVIREIIRHFTIIVRIIINFYLLCNIF